MEKAEVLRICIKTQEEKIKNLRQSLENTRQSAADAPGSNVSHSDTTKFQLSNLALGIQKRLTETNLALNQLRQIKPTASDSIFVGTLFTLKNIGDKKVSRYLLIPKDGGISFNVKGREIASMSIEAPLAQAVMGKQKGDKINFRGKVLEIIEVQ